MPVTFETRGGKSHPTSGEQALVDEFTVLFRKHQNEDPTTVARSLNVAFNISIGTDGTRQDKLARAMVRGIEARQQLAETEGGSLSSDQAARLLGISKTAVLKRLNAGRLLAWREERLQAARFPRWQFNARGRVLAGLGEILAIFGQNPHLDEWGRVLFFLQEKSSLGGRRPLDLLREGKVNESCVAARAYAE